MEDIRSAFSRLVSNIEANLAKDDASNFWDHPLCQTIDMEDLRKQLDGLVKGFKDCKGDSKKENKFVVGQLKQLKQNQKWKQNIDFVLDVLSFLMRQGDFLNHEEIVNDLRFICFVALNV